jgi:hypothetical protein
MVLLKHIALVCGTCHVVLEDFIILLLVSCSIGAIGVWINEIITKKYRD